jgi:microcin C transport system ATP-binding protein
VEAGPARQVFASPQHPYTQALLAAALNLEAVSKEEVVSI